MLGAAELTPIVSLVVAAEDVAAGKPQSVRYLRALELLDRRADEALAFETPKPESLPQRRQGLYCIALEGTAEIERLVAADEVQQARLTSG